jgi:hypothetical protein
MRTRAQDDSDYGDGAHLSLRVSVHLSARTTAEVTTYLDEARATIEFNGFRGSTGVTLFVRTPELRELRDLLSETLTTLAAADSATDSTEAVAGATDRAA